MLWIVVSTTHQIINDIGRDGSVRGASDAPWFPILDVLKGRLVVLSSILLITVVVASTAVLLVVGRHVDQPSALHLDRWGTLRVLGFLWVYLQGKLIYAWVLYCMS